MGDTKIADLFLKMFTIKIRASLFEIHDQSRMENLIIYIGYVGLPDFSDVIILFNRKKKKLVE